MVVVGGGFGGLNCARRLGGCSELEVLVIDRRNHHLFQPLLYQVAMAGLSPAEIAAPIRSLLSGSSNTTVLQASVEGIDVPTKRVRTDRGEFGYDTLVLAAGAQHAYFGHNEWEEHAPGLKTLEQATEIRRRVLGAFERAETEANADERKALLTFVVVGAGPTGVELAGAIGEMSRFTLAKDYRNIDPTHTRVILIEAGPRILPSFAPALSARAMRDLEKLGVQVWTESRVTNIDGSGVTVGAERIATRTALWAAGVQASELSRTLPAEPDRMGRVPVDDHLRLVNHPEVFVIGDQACAKGPDGRPLPGVATVALQQGRYVADLIRALRSQREVRPFRYWDKGQLATIGRRRALLQSGSLKLAGFVAWIAWLLVHIYYLSGFRNRVLVLIQWAWSYATFSRGARLVVEKTWRSYPS